MVATSTATGTATAAAAAATSAAAGSDRVLPTSLIRCRQWLLPHRSSGSHARGCPDRYDDNMGLASPPRTSSISDGELTNTEAPSAAYQPTQMPLLQWMSSRGQRASGSMFGSRSGGGAPSAARWPGRITSAIRNGRSLSRTRMGASQPSTPVTPTAADRVQNRDTDERQVQPAQRESASTSVVASSSRANVPRAADNETPAGRPWPRTAISARSEAGSSTDGSSESCSHVSDTRGSADSDQLRTRARSSATTSVGIETISEADEIDGDSESLCVVEPDNLEEMHHQPPPSLLPISPMSMSTVDVHTAEHADSSDGAAYRAWQCSCCLEDLRAANAEAISSDVFTSAYTRHMVNRQAAMDSVAAAAHTSEAGVTLAQQPGTVESRARHTIPSRPQLDVVAAANPRAFHTVSSLYGADEHTAYDGRYGAAGGSYAGDVSEYLNYGQSFIESGHGIESEYGDGMSTLDHSRLDPDVSMHAASHNALGEAGMAPESSMSTTPNPAMPNASAIAHIFAIGQPSRPKGHSGISKARRLSKRLLRMIPQSLRAGSTHTRPLTEADRVCSDALLSTFATESSLSNAIRLLERTRSTRSSSFRMRADRVHSSQSQLLCCIYELFAQLVPEEEQRSRHYRFYLPEDDQTELDRGFSESVLFAAQALARGFQIRGTELYTQSLREPAWLLCSAWAAVRYVIFARGSSLWCIWDHGLMHQAEHAPSPSSSSVLSPQDELGALRGVLADFDEAWVRFERDLCFAYFGLSNAQLAGAMDPNEADGQVAQEEEFSLLVVLLSETLQRSIAQDLVTEEQMEAMEPQLILALPRLAILHAIARGGVDGLRFVESEDAPVFWWFREYTQVCRKTSDAVSQWAAEQYEVLQKMLAAEEADVVWTTCENSLYVSLASARGVPMCLAGSTKRADVPTGAAQATVDALSVADIPRSIDIASIDLASSVCGVSSDYSGPGAAEHLSTQLSAVHDDHGSSTLSPLGSTQCLSVDKIAGSTPHSPVQSPRTHPSPVMAVSAAVSSMSLSDTPRSVSRLAADANGPAVRNYELAVCKEATKQVYVDICTVADSLHSGPFARPFRVALELVFRMNMGAGSSGS
ncbi:hypothetical protein GQ54DRAFT_132792 [Martensiomyces pterosporus]|nr:hypothetical protein GQ54DRAFT_132792 [Martensiomyces pterosporus]